jgi:hypothetical protein
MVNFGFLIDPLPFQRISWRATTYILYLSTSSAVTFLFPACRRVRTFQVPKRIIVFVSLLRNLGRFREDSPVSITEFFVTGWFSRDRVVTPAPNAQRPTWKTRVPLFVWVIALDLSGLGGPTSSTRDRQHSWGG